MFSKENAHQRRRVFRAFPANFPAHISFYLPHTTKQAAKMASYKLSYFNGKGLAEQTRLLFAATGTAFEDHRVTYATHPDGTRNTPEFDALKPVLPMGQLPVLYVTKDGATSALPQSKAIERYLARELGLFGASAEQGAVIDAVAEVVVDIKSKFNAAKADEAKKAAFFGAGGDLQTLLSYIERTSSAHSAGFTIGDKLSLADLIIYHLFTIWFTGADKEAAHAVLNSAAPTVAAALAKTSANEGLAKWEAERSSRDEVF